jgi:hypothetical protein
MLSLRFQQTRRDAAQSQQQEERERGNPRPQADKED